MTFEFLAEAGAPNETNDLFIFGSPVPLLVDSTLVVYTDQAVGGSLAVADLRKGTGWSVHHAGDANGPGELNGRVPLLSTSGDTIKTLRPDGRLTARLIDGTVLYDSIIPRTAPPPMMSFSFGLAGNKRVSEYHVEGDPIRLGILLESASGQPVMIQLGTIRPNADGGFRSPFTVRARGDLVVYLEGQTVTTLDPEGRQIARIEVPWRPINTIIDGTGRVWVQVLGGVSEGYNLMLFTEDLDLIGKAVIPRFRDAYGDYALTTRRDSLNAELLILSRRKN